MAMRGSPVDLIPSRGGRGSGQYKQKKTAEGLGQERIVLSPEFAEDAIALAFTKKHGYNLRYTAAWGRWNVWSGTHWKQDDTYCVSDKVRDLCREVSLSCEDKK